MANKIEKMTNRKALEYIKDTYGEVLPAEVVEKVEGMIAQLVKKSTADRKPTKAQQENEQYIAMLTEFMADGTDHSIAECIKGIPAFADFNTSKVSALMKKLKDAEIVERIEIKGRAYFHMK